MKWYITGHTATHRSPNIIYLQRTRVMEFVCQNQSVTTVTDDIGRVELCLWIFGKHAAPKRWLDSITGRTTRKHNENREIVEVDDYHFSVRLIAVATIFCVWSTQPAMAAPKLLDMGASYVCHVLNKIPLENEIVIYWIAFSLSIRTTHIIAIFYIRNILHALALTRTRFLCVSSFHSLDNNNK